MKKKISVQSVLKKGSFFNFFVSSFNPNVQKIKVETKSLFFKEIKLHTHIDEKDEIVLEN